LVNFEKDNVLLHQELAKKIEVNDMFKKKLVVTRKRAIEAEDRMKKMRSHIIDLEKAINEEKELSKQCMKILKQQREKK